ncbi:recombinase family protein [Salipaludibacillus sp. CF4.18]|uniref:recombinase family protein n=1 Tax=Salipaludibacillus sp. CF4.18 TaxID=3373081 RepID=UPI003EE5D021
MRLYGYVRVSTVGQSRQGNSLEHQINQLGELGVSQDAIYIDSYTGSKVVRPEFSKLLSILQPGDKLIVTKLDRFARSLIEGVKIIDGLLERGVAIHILNMGVLDHTPTSILMRNIFLAFAEFERTMIIERTAEGKAIAKQKEGYREGRPKSYTPKQLNHAIGMLKNYSYKEVVEITGISKSTLIREKRLRSY